MALEKTYNIPNTSLQLVDAYHKITDVNIIDDENNVTIIVNVATKEDAEAKPYLVARYDFALSAFGGDKSNITYENMYNQLKQLPMYQDAIDC